MKLVVKAQCDCGRVEEKSASELSSNLVTSGLSSEDFAKAKGKFKQGGWEITDSGDICPFCQEESPMKRILKTFDPDEGVLPGES